MSPELCRSHSHFKVMLQFCYAACYSASNISVKAQLFRRSWRSGRWQSKRFGGMFLLIAYRFTWKTFIDHCSVTSFCFWLIDGENMDILCKRLWKAVLLREENQLYESFEKREPNMSELLLWMNYFACAFRWNISFILDGLQQKKPKPIKSFFCIIS